MFRTLALITTLFVKNDRFLLSAWLHHESSGKPRETETTYPQSAPFSDALARLFHAASEAGALRNQLHDMLALER